MMMRGGGWFRYMHGRDSEAKPNVTWRLLLRVLAYAKPYRPQIAGMLATILLTTGLGLLSPLIFREIIDQALPQKDFAKLNLLALGLVAIVVAAGALFYDVAVPRQTLPALIVALGLGAATFCALGVAMTAAIPQADAAPAIVNAVVLPLMFVSDLFIPMHNAPEWLTLFASIFPVRHFAQALHAAFNPYETGLGFAWPHLLALAAWLAVGVLIATRYFRWESRR
jgi:ABC-type multidrug transport system fused ATPase/permease subunit